MTETELFAALEALDKAERDLRVQRAKLEEGCRAYGQKIGYGGRFRIDHLRINYNYNRVKEQAA